MSTERMIETRRHGRVMEIIMNRPPANAINRAASREIYAALKELQDDPDLSVGVIVGTGERIFSAGWDLKELAADGYDPALDADPVHGNGPGGFAGITEYYDLCKPVIAAVNGAAIGGGFEIVLACDVVIMADNAYYALPEMQRGFLADAGAIQRLPRRIPYNVAVEMMLSGRPMDAEEALKWGLANEVVPQADLRPRAIELALELSKGAPLAMQAMKEVLREIQTMSLEDALALTKPGANSLAMYEKMVNSDDFMEGPTAFAEKREPKWTGR